MLPIIYKFKKSIVVKPSNEISFLLSNNIGGFALFSSNSDAMQSSRYNGLYFNNNFELFKTIERIVPLNSGLIKSVVYDFSKVQNEYDHLTETYIMPFSTNALYYSLDKENDVEIWLDVKKPYDNREFGRIYNVYEESGKIIIEFTKRTDRKEDGSSNEEEYKVYAALLPIQSKAAEIPAIAAAGKKKSAKKSESSDEKPEFKKIEDWVNAKYGYDRKRNSPPFERHVFKALKLKCKNLVIAVGKQKKKAMIDADFVANNIDSIKKESSIRVEMSDSIANHDIEMAYLCCQHSLDSLVCSVNHLQGIYAGLPWFFQFWSRDELISLKALMQMNRMGLAKEILLKHMNAITENGRLLNKFPPSSKEKEKKENADAIGWLFTRALDYVNLLQSRGRLDNEEKILLYELKARVSSCIYRLNETSMKSGLVVNKTGETWMDSVCKDDKRAGARIEMQALMLNMHRLREKIASLLGDRTWEKISITDQEKMVKTVRKSFWNEFYLKDGANDHTVRPNVFLAYYIYPKLLSISEWETCFDVLLKYLWLDWGGLSSIDKNHPPFLAEHSGEDSRSYHRGDSWYWINNIAAIAMHRLNPRKYKTYIDKIVNASVNDILSMGIAGAGSEISSASKQQAFGCLNQAWSNATFIELVNEIYPRK